MYLGNENIKYNHKMGLDAFLDKTLVEKDLGEYVDNALSLNFHIQ